MIGIHPHRFQFGANKHHRYLSTQINSNCCDFSHFIARIPHKMSMSAAENAAMTYMNIQSLGVKGFLKKTAKSTGKNVAKNIIFAHGSPTKTASNAEPSVEASDNSAAPITPPRKGK